jgi:hypothetical protein
MPTVPAITECITYWDHYANGIPKEAPEEALKNAFGWTQYDGPGDELLGDPVTALELGSSRGYAVAALAAKGIDATGIDLSPVRNPQFPCPAADHHAIVGGLYGLRTSAMRLRITG